MTAYPNACRMAAAIPAPPWSVQWADLSGVPFPILIALRREHKATNLRLQPVKGVDNSIEVVCTSNFLVANLLGIGKESGEGNCGLPPQ